jgi:hypothetical protein
MSELAQAISAGLRSGRYRDVFHDYCLTWRVQPTQYVLQNICHHLADSLDGGELFLVLTDAAFRRRKSRQLGPDAVRADLGIGLDFFSRREPDLLRYVQLLSIQQADKRNRKSVRSSTRRNCVDYLRFFQLDVPAHQRRHVGLHRFLTESFPVNLRMSGERVRVALLSYEVGRWRCRCGDGSSHARRYEYSCACGAVAGNGLLAARPQFCRACSGRPAYWKCFICNERVTLDLVWRAAAGGLNLSDLRMPLDLMLSVESSGVSQTRGLTLMWFPVPVGLRQQAGRIVVDSPGLLWVSGDEDPRASLFAPETATLVPFRKTVRYQETTGLLAALDGVLREVISSAALRKHVRSLVQAGPDARFGNSIFTDEFATKLLASKSGIVQRSVRPAELFPNLEEKLECEVAASASLHGEMAVVDRRLTSTSGFSAPLIASHTVTLGADETGADELTPQPAGRTGRATHLEDDGIARVGSEVGSEDVLVGVRSNRSRGLNRDQKLLNVLKGPDISLRMPRYASGRVLAVDIQVAGEQRTAAFRPLSGRTISAVPSWDRAAVSRVTVTVALNQSIYPGDVLYQEDHSRAVVCAITPSREIETESDSRGPCVLVAPDHPWLAGAPEGRTRVVLRLGVPELFAHLVTSRGTGPSSVNNRRPVVGIADGAQIFSARDFTWLVTCGALAVAEEITRYHSDCAVWDSYYQHLINGEDDVPVGRAPFAPRPSMVPQRDDPHRRLVPSHVGRERRARTREIIAGAIQSYLERAGPRRIGGRSQGPDDVRSGEGQARSKDRGTFL